MCGQNLPYVLFHIKASKITITVYRRKKQIGKLTNIYKIPLL